MREVKVFILAFLLISLTGCTSTNGGEEPSPTKTVYVPVPDSGISNNYDSNLDEIKQSNCRLADELTFQSLDLSREARNLESQALSMGINSDSYFQLMDQARSLQQQSINLLIQSDQLRQNC